MDGQHEINFPCPSVPEDAGAARLLGLYPQRQEGLWMQRVKVLGGVLTAQEWRALGKIAQEFAPTAPLHLTTRQDVELHDITPERVGPLQHALAEAGLTGVGACGDTLRNITVCPCSGVRNGTVDLVPLAWQIRRTLEAMDGILALPRKFKISLSCGESCGQPWINDLGFVARRKHERWGLFVAVGGSLGAKPGTGMRLFDWLPVEDVLPLTVATLRVFTTHGDREHRNRARLRHVRERLGDEAFAAVLKESLDVAKAERAWPEAGLAEANAGFNTSSTLTFANGNVTLAAAEALAELTTNDDVRVRVANHHRVMLFGRNTRQLHERVTALKPLTEAARPQAAVVACPGTRWCSRALADTNQVAARIRVELGGVLTPETTVCISGCPNGCAHSAVADIGLTGRLVRRDGQKVQAYDLWAGGGMGRNCKLARLEGQRLSPEEAIKETARLAAELC